jgi:transposase
MVSMKIDTLPNDIAELKTLLLQAHQEQRLWKEKYESLLESFKLAKQRQFASSSEAHLLQDSLFDEDDTPTPEDEEPSESAIEVTAHQRKRHPKRRPIPKHFPREKIWCDLSDSEKICDCGCQKTRIGEEISEQLDVIPPSFKVMQYIRPKYSCKKCQIGVSIAKLPPVLLPKCIAASGLVAYTITAKYVDHLPLYRQAQIWQRYGVDLPRNTLCGWLMKTAEKCEMLWSLIAEHILSGDYIQADESPVQVLDEPSRRDQQKSYIWVYRGGPPGKTGVYFVYQETRAGQHAQEFLKSFKGYLQTDGYKGYDWTDDQPDMIHLACMAHARRPFAEMVKLSKKAGKSHEAIKFIEELYAIEEEARASSAQNRYQLRLQQAKPKLEKIKLWLDKSIRGSPPKGKLGKAIQYMLDRWDQLNHYLLDGQLQIDNNLIENDIRLFALGKKNWLFKGSPRGAKAGSIFYSLIKTAQANQLDPYQYLRYILTKLPLCQERKNYVALLPWNLTADTIKT